MASRSASPAVQYITITYIPLQNHSACQEDNRISTCKCSINGDARWRGDQAHDCEFWEKPQITTWKKFGPLVILALIRTRWWNISIILATPKCNTYVQHIIQALKFWKYTLNALNMTVLIIYINDIINVFGFDWKTLILDLISRLGLFQNPT